MAIEVVLNDGRIVRVPASFDAATLRQLLAVLQEEPMLNLPLPVRVYLCLEPTDMRKSFDGLCRMVRDFVGADPLSGDLFVFRSKRGDRVKLLYWLGDGLAIWYRRLEEGTFVFPKLADTSGLSWSRTVGAQGLEIRATDLALLLDGIDLPSVKRQKRYERPQAQPSRRRRPGRPALTGSATAWPSGIDGSKKAPSYSPSWPIPRGCRGRAPSVPKAWRSAPPTWPCSWTASICPASNAQTLRVPTDATGQRPGRPALTAAARAFDISSFLRFCRATLSRRPCFIWYETRTRPHLDRPLPPLLRLRRRRLPGRQPPFSISANSPTTRPFSSK